MFGIRISCMLVFIFSCFRFEAAITVWKSFKSAVTPSLGLCLFFLPNVSVSVWLTFKLKVPNFNVLHLVCGSLQGSIIISDLSTVMFFSV